MAMLPLMCYLQVSMAHNAHEAMCYQWLQSATGFATVLKGVGQLCGPIALQVITT